MRTIEECLESKKQSIVGLGVIALTITEPSVVVVSVVTAGACVNHLYGGDEPWVALEPADNKTGRAHLYYSRQKSAGQLDVFVELNDEQAEALIQTALFKDVYE